MGFLNNVAQVVMLCMAAFGAGVVGLVVADCLGFIGPSGDEKPSDAWVRRQGKKWAAEERQWMLDHGVAHYSEAILATTRRMRAFLVSAVAIAFAAGLGLGFGLAGLLR
jgi:hypothetical protein